MPIASTPRRYIYDPELENIRLLRPDEVIPDVWYDHQGKVHIQHSDGSSMIFVGAFQDALVMTHEKSSGVELHDTRDGLRNVGKDTVQYKFTFQDGLVQQTATIPTPVSIRLKRMEIDENLYETLTGQSLSGDDIDDDDDLPFNNPPTEEELNEFDDWLRAKSLNSREDWFTTDEDEDDDDESLLDFDEDETLAELLERRRNKMFDVQKNTKPPARGGFVRNPLWGREVWRPIGTFEVGSDISPSEIRQSVENLKKEMKEALRPTPDRSNDANWGEEAMEIVRNARQSSYGHPVINFSRIVSTLNWLIRGKLKPGEWITPVEWAYIVVMTKVAREIHNHKRDNGVDIIGYTLTHNAIDEGMKRLGYEDGANAFKGMNEDEFNEFLRRLEQDEDFLALL